MKNYLLYTEKREFGNEIMQMVRRKINPTAVHRDDSIVTQIINSSSKWTLMTEYQQSVLCGERFNEVYVDNDIDRNTNEYKNFIYDVEPRIIGYRGVVYMDYTEEGLFLEML
jgi:hypothetical protein